MHSFKKIAAAVVMAGFLATPVAAFAQTSSASSLQALLAQIVALQAQIKALQAQKQETVATLAATLKQGDRGENVRMLQQLLAADPSLYPEGTVSGYYGRLTSAAIKRFQKQHGISQVGNVGPQTLRKLNEIFGKRGNNGNNGNSGRDHEEDDYVVGTSTTPGAGKTTICHKPGKSNQTLFVANPALQAHMNHGDTMGVCGGGTATTTPDTTMPVISGVSATAITTTGATIVWNTNEGSTMQVQYGTTTAYGSLSTLNSTLMTSHSVELSGLTPNTMYNYIVWSKDAANNTATSTNMTFMTAALDTTAPVLSSVMSSAVATTTATVSWNTNESATGKVYFGTANPLVLASATATSTSALSTGHTFGLTGLTASTTYYFVVESMDAANNTATSSQMWFTTTN